MRSTLAVTALATLLVGCASRQSELGLQPGAYQNLQVSGTTGLPPPTGVDPLSEARPYLIGPFDKLRIDVFGIEEMDREVQTDASGRISFPLVGMVDATGKTPQELEREIEQRLRERHVRDPQVTVNLTETVSQVVTIDGEVRQPGLYPVVGRLTLMRAIATARGTTEYARQSNVLIFREVDGQNLVGLYNLRAIRQGSYPDPEVFPEDVIVVDEARARRLFREMLQLAPLLTTPLVAVLQNSN